MTEFEPQLIAEKMFARVRQAFDLGANEYFVVLQALEGGWGTRSEDDLKEVLQLLWCKSDPDRAHFQSEWDRVIETIEKQQPPPSKTPPTPKSGSPLSSEISTNVTPQPPEGQPSEQPQTETQLEFAPYPVKVPPKPMLETDEMVFLESDYPITRRSMSYSWRYLRRYAPTGAATVLDVNATVETVTRQGFFLAPVYQRELKNQVRLVLLVDRNGSMMPLHHFTRDLVETARYESYFDSEQVGVFYFHNVPAASVYADPYLTRPVVLQNILNACDLNTCIFIVSDAGAARGYRQRSRIRSTAKVLRQIRQHTSAVAWLNPMPSHRWSETSAQILRHLVPMFPMTTEGLGDAISTVRTQLGD